MEYTVATGSGTTALSTEVNKLISEGWQPLGGVSMIRLNETIGSVTELGYIFAQAMIKQ